MAGREHAQLLLRELGERIGLAGLEFDQDGYVALGFDDVLVSLEFDDATELLLLYSHLGRPGGDAAALHRAMLDANLFWRGTGGGATLARESATGGLVLQQRSAIAGMDLPRFEALLKSFVDAAEGWMRQVGQDRDAATPMGHEAGTMQVADLALAGRYA